MKIQKWRFNISAQTYDLTVAGEEQEMLITAKKDEIDDIIIDFKIENPEVLN